MADRSASGPARRSLLAALALAGLGVRAQVPGTPWPELGVRTREGRPVVGGDAPWRATYVDFWASWCAPCRLSFPWMNAMHERLGPAGLRIVAVNLDRREADAQQFLARYPARFEIALDPQAASAKLLDVQAMPTSMLVAADRRIIFVHRGFRDDDPPALEQRLRAALA